MSESVVTITKLEALLDSREKQYNQIFQESV